MRPNIIDITNVINPMTQHEAHEWVDALRSGKYRRGAGALRVVKYYPSGNRMHYCCLGVEQKVHPEQCRSVRGDGLLSSDDNRGPSTEWSRLPESIQSTLANMNDGGYFSFKKIADYIESEIAPNLPA